MDKVLYAREVLKSFVPLIDKKLQEIRIQQKKLSINSTLFPKSEKINDIAIELLDHIAEHNARPAKRLRASLIYYGYKLIKGEKLKEEEEQSLLMGSASIELVHTGLIIHDDYQDQDAIRRGSPTTHKHYEMYHDQRFDAGDKEHFGASMAINAGDFCITIGYWLLLKSGFGADCLFPALDYMLQGISQTVYGQSFDIILENQSQFIEQDVYDLHHTKTGIYTYLTPLLVGVTLAGGSEDIKHKLMEYAIPCGVAFQLQDDVIGIFGNEEKTGKSAYSDIKEGKKTLLMLKTLELCRSDEKEIILGLLGKHDLSSEQAEYVRSIVKSCGALDYSYKKAEEYARQAQKVIEQLRLENGGLNKNVLDYLEGIAEYMAVRREI